VKIVKPSAELLAITPNALELIERAARTCYHSQDSIAPGTAERLVKSCMNKNHMSVLEHASATFQLVTDRGVMAELTRHRIASFSIQSTRYCSYAKDKFDGQISVIEPPGLEVLQRLIWLAAAQRAEDGYLDMLDVGSTPEIARSVLPMCLATEIVITANFREWLHILDLRTSPAAHPQIREVMGLVQKILQEQVPVIFGAA
jgi:thymidylate synthase (FAD)